jgi:hypothetical protein
MSQLTWKRDGRGRQVTACGRYAVEVDGYTPGLMMDPLDLKNGIRPCQEHAMGDGGEWAAITTNNNENLDWFPTARQAKAECQAHADRDEILQAREANSWG